MSKTRSKIDRSAVIVLGMHRSGTSALAGVLELLGCDMPGTLMVPNENNEKGYFESNKLYQMHSELFASAATRWDDWLPISATWFEGSRAVEFHERAVETMVAEYGKSRLLLIKDPRICRLVPFWDGVLAEQKITPRYVLTHRNPLEVAASLRKRDGLSTGHGLLIWLRHVLEAEHGTRGQIRCFTSFVQLITNWAGVAGKIQTDLGLNFPRFSLGVAPEVDGFLEGSLRHHREAPEKVLNNPMLSVWIRDTYEILERWADDGEEPADHLRLDEIRAAFDASGPAFAEVIQSGRAQVERLSGEVAHHKKASEEENREVEEARQALKTLQAGTDARESEHAARLQERTRALEQLEEAHDAQAAELNKLRHQLAQERSALEQRSHEAEQTHKALEELQAELAEMTRIMAQKEAEIEQERDAARETLAQERKAAQEAFERERSARISSETRVAALDNQLQTQFREMADLSRLLSQSEQAQATALEQAQEREHTQAGEREREREQAQEHARILSEEITALRASSSWRITQPLRTVVNWMRGARN